VEEGISGKKASDQVEAKAREQRKAIRKKEGKLREKEDGRRKQEWERMKLAESNWVAASRDRAIRDGHIDEAETVRNIAKECRA
jgi:hypothetical protein